MASTLVFLSGGLVDYAAKLSLMACLWQEPHLRFHFAALAAAHIATNAHGTFAHCRSVPKFPRGPVLVAVVAVFGVATPLMQAVHVVDMAVGWWTSQDLGRRPALRPAPLDVVLEGTVFACASAHLRLGLFLGHLEGPAGSASFPLTFEALLVLTLGTSLLSTAASLVLWDSAQSVKLSRDLYGWPGRATGGGARGVGLFVLHLVVRFSEVAGKSLLLAALTVLFGSWAAAGYVALTYAVNVVVLLLVSRREAPSWPLAEVAVLAWPLLFANLPQFVDCPKHLAAATHVASFTCSIRAVEMAVALSLIVAAVLLEGELDDGLLGLRSVSGSAAGCAKQAALSLLSLYRARAAAGCGLCFLVHYVSMAFRWCGAWGPLGILSTPTRLAAGRAAGFGGRPSALHVGRRGGHPPGWPDPVDRAAGGEDKDFWPPAASLAPLLFAAACERPPAACGLISILASSSTICSAVAVEPRPRMEDFEVIRLIGCGEFGKVFQVRQHSTGRFFAMKRLEKEFYAQKRMTDKAVREIAMLSLARNHPFVVKLSFTVETSREWAIVMEYCPRGDLQQLLLAEGFPGLPLDRTLWISAEVALALEYLHTNSIVFRDLKLENVVLDGEGHAKLTDFGLAKQHRSGQDAIAQAELAGGVYESFAKTFCGSYGYVAPEVNPRRQVHGYAADLYSLGVLLLMMLMGGEVYRDTREPLFEKRLPPETPGELRDLINSLSFEFYWAAHHLLQPSRAAHRVEVNLDGAVVIVPRGPRGVRRQARPHNPPTSPRGGEDEAAAPGPSGRPVHFPTLAGGSSEAARRRWDLALDLVRSLTREFPEQRGTVASVKRHPFFTEEIDDWRLVYPRSWLIDRLEEKLRPSWPARGALPRHVSQWLGRAPKEELLRLQDDPHATAGALARRCPQVPEDHEQAEGPPVRSEAEEPPAGDAWRATRASRGSSPTSSRHSWCEHYP